MIMIFSVMLTAERWRSCYWYKRLLQQWESLPAFLHTVNRLFTASRRTIILGMGLSLLLHAVVITAIVALAKAYHIPPASLLFVACTAPLGLIAAMLPIAGHGVRETAFVYLLSQVGIIPEVALTISVNIYIILALVSLLGGSIYLFAPNWVS